MHGREREVSLLKPRSRVIAAAATTTERQPDARYMAPELLGSYASPPTHRPAFASAAHARSPTPPSPFVLPTAMHSPSPPNPAASSPLGPQTAEQQCQSSVAATRHYRIAPGMPPRTDEKKKLFEDSVAISGDYRHSDREPRPWLTLVRNYLVGRAHEMEILLKWAEGWQETPIGFEHIEACRGHHSIGEVCPMRLSRELWSFLNLNVTGMNAKEARRAFDGVPRLNWFEGWRKIVVPLGPKSAARISNLYDDVRRPTRAKNLLEFEARIEEWEQDITRYVVCGGARTSPMGEVHHSS